VLKPELSEPQLEAALTVLEPLLGRLRAQAAQLPPHSDSALVYVPVQKSEAP